MARQRHDDLKPLLNTRQRCRGRQIQVLADIPMLANAEFHKRFANTYVSFRPAGNGPNHEADGLTKTVEEGHKRSALVVATILAGGSVVGLRANKGGHLADIKIIAYCLATGYIQSRRASRSRTPF